MTLVFVVGLLLIALGLVMRGKTMGLKPLGGANEKEIRFTGEDHAEGEFVPIDNTIDKWVTIDLEGIYKEAIEQNKEKDWLRTEWPSNSHYRIKNHRKFRFYLKSGLVFHKDSIFAVKSKQEIQECNVHPSLNGLNRCFYLGGERSVYLGDNTKKLKDPDYYTRFTIPQEQFDFLRDLITSCQQNAKIKTIEQRKIEKAQKREETMAREGREIFRQEKEKVLRELDKDGDGKVDAMEEQELNALIKKHQVKILEVNGDLIKSFVKIDAFLKNKKENAQIILKAISATKAEEATFFNELEGVLRNEIHTYQTVLANGIVMLVALVRGDRLTYEEIYESMDRINIFDSKWERDVSKQLTKIGNELNELIFEIEASNQRIVDELSNLTYTTNKGFNELNSSITKELQSIDSSVKFNNLLTGIQTYQMYRMNRSAKSVRK